MPSSPPNSRERALSLLFSGYSAREAAGKVGVTNPTVSGWLKVFIREAEEAGSIMAAAARYGIGEQVRQLIEIGGVIEATHVDPAKAKVGLEIINALTPFGVKPEGIPGFVKAVYREAEQQHLPPEILVKIAKTMYDLDIKEKKDYKAFTDGIVSQDHQLRTLKSQVLEYEKKADDSRNSMNETLKNNDVTTKDLIKFTSLRERLAPHGLEMGDLDKVESCIVNIAEQGYDSETVVSTYSQGVGLKKRLEEEEAKAKELSANNEKAAKELEEKNRFLESNAKLAEQVQKAKKLGFDASQLEAVVEAAHDVGARHELGQREALDKLVSDLKQNWEPKLGFENEVTRLQARKDGLSVDIKDGEKNLKRLNTEIALKQVPLTALDGVKNRGVGEDELPQWNDVLEASGCSLHDFRKEVKRLGGVKPFVDTREAELTVNLRNLKVEERKIRATLEELTGLEAALRSQISTLMSEPVNSTIETLADLKKTAETVKAASTQLKSEFDDPETGLKAKSKEIIARIGEDWKLEVDTQVKNIKATGETVSKTISSLTGQVNKVMEVSYESGKTVGYYKHSGNLLRIMKGEPIDRLTGLITLASALQASGEWLRANGMSDLGQQFNTMARSLEGRMRA